MASVTPDRTWRDHWRARIYLGRDINGAKKWREVKLCPRGCAQRGHERNPRHDGTKRGQGSPAKIADRLEGELRAKHGAAVTLTDVLDRWLTSGIHAQSTVVGYRSRSALRIIPALGGRYIGDIRPVDIAAYRDHWAGRLAPSSVNQDLAIIRGAFRYAVGQGWLDASPMRDISRVPDSVKQQPLPDESSIAAVFAHLTRSSPEVARAAMVALLTGARRGEICALTWGDVDWINGAVTIRHGINPDRTLKPTKTRQQRVIPLAPDLHQALIRWHDELGDPPADWPIIGAPRSPSRHMAPDTISQAIYRIRREHDQLAAPCPMCGRRRIKRTWMHGLRHEAGTRMGADGVPQATIMAVLGHTQIGTTSRYLHGEDTSMRDAVAAIGRTRAELPAGI